MGMLTGPAGRGTELGLSLGATAMQAGAALQTGSYTQAVAQRNALIARQAAGDALARGALSESVSRLRAGQVAGAQKSAIVAGNAALSSGSALAAEATTSAMSDMDADIIRNNAHREAMGLQTRASLFEQQGDLAVRASRYEAAGSILAGLGKVAGIVGPALKGAPMDVKSHETLLNRAPAPEPDEEDPGFSPIYKKLLMNDGKGIDLPDGGP